MIGTYNRKTGDIYDDFTPFYGTLNPGLHYFLQAGHSKTWSFEARLASPKGEHFDWLIGATHIDTEKGFEEHLQSPGYAANHPAEQAAGLLEGDEYYSAFSYTGGDENALFGEANVHFGPVTVTAGGRLFKTATDTWTEQYGVFFGGHVTNPVFDVKDDGFAPKVSIKYEHDNVMVYALASKGYRFGSPNTIFPLAGFDTPDGTSSDSLWNYEIGTRFDLIDRTLFVSATAFYIDWSNLQVRLVRPDGFTYGANAGAAEIKGVEASASLRLGGFALDSNVTYLDSELSEDIPTASPALEEGKRLPSAARWRISNTASYDFGGAAEPTITLLHRYVSRSPGFLNEETSFDPYHVFDARVSATVNGVRIAAYVENFTDKRAITFGYQDYGQGATRYIVRPRTFGLQLNWAM
jgi:outer membrane receptor protein involved in Fe transport